MKNTALMKYPYPEATDNTETWTYWEGLAEAADGPNAGYFAIANATQAQPIGTAWTALTWATERASRGAHMVSSGLSLDTPGIWEIQFTARVGAGGAGLLYVAASGANLSTEYGAVPTLAGTASYLVEMTTYALVTDPAVVGFRMQAGAGTGSPSLGTGTIAARWWGPAPATAKAITPIAEPPDPAI